MALQHQGPVTSGQFSLDGSGILTWSEDGTARLWDARTGQSIGPALQHQGPAPQWDAWLWYACTGS